MLLCFFRQVFRYDVLHKGKDFLPILDEGGQKGCLCQPQSIDKNGDTVCWLKIDKNAYMLYVERTKRTKWTLWIRHNSEQDSSRI